MHLHCGDNIVAVASAQTVYCNINFNHFVKYSINVILA